MPYGATGVEPISEEPLLPEETLAYARALLDEGRPFAAHQARGNDVGASRLVERAAGRLEAYVQAAGPTYGLDLAALVACARGRVLGG